MPSDRPCPSALPHRGLRAFAPIAVGLAASVALAGPTFEEGSDAGSTPGTAQPVAGPSGSAVARISGVLNGTADAVDFEDVYVICITDPVAFSATVNAAGTNFDTQLWLFDLQGFGLLSNDNSPITFPTIYSHIQQPATDGTGQTIPGPGLYLLAISSKQNHAASNAGPIFADASFNGTEISGPDGPGSALPLTTWTQGDGTVDGQYIIDLTGVKFVDLPCDATCPAEATIDADIGDCVVDGNDPNGGCGTFGSPLQPLGTLSPNGYIAVCGTTGTIPPSHRDADWFRFHLDAPTYVTASLVMTLPNGLAAPNALIEMTRGDDCATMVTVFSSAGGPCPTNSGPIALPAGDHTVLVSVDAFAPGGPPCPVEYLLWLGAAGAAFDLCGDPAAGTCGIAHPSAGCSDLACCDQVCSIDPFCCDLSWDALCANQALATCNDEPYLCLPSVVPNDCATTPDDLPPEGAASFDTTLATTDGPGDDAGECSSGKDVWYRLHAPATGKFLVSTCDATSFDCTLAAYRLPLTGVVDPTVAFDGEHLIACNDDGCGSVGGPSILDVRVSAGDSVLIRVGGFVEGGIPASGTGTITVRFLREIFSTGPTYPVLYDQSNGGAVIPTNVAFSSGKLSLAQPQRWMAQGFTVAEGPLGGGYRLRAIHGYGVGPPAAVNETLTYIVWHRTRTERPEDGDQVATGSVPFPVPADLPEGAPANEDHRIIVEPGIDLEPGDYWLTLYAANTQPANVPANFAWFVSAANGVNVISARADGPFMWRSAAFPVPGFVPFALPASTLQQVPQADPLDLYNAGFELCGTPIEPPCIADLTGDGVVGGDDLAIVLGAWGQRGPGNLDGVGVVDGADLSLVLGAWGPCPD